MDGTMPAWAEWNAGAADAPWTVGIEEEVMLVSPATWLPVSRCEDVLAALPDAIADRARAETHGSALELATNPHTLVSGAAALVNLEGGTRLVASTAACYPTSYGIPAGFQSFAVYLDDRGLLTGACLLTNDFDRRMLLVSIVTEMSWRGQPPLLHPRLEYRHVAERGVCVALVSQEDLHGLARVHGGGLGNQLRLDLVAEAPQGPRAWRRAVDRRSSEREASFIAQFKGEATFRESISVHRYDERARVVVVSTSSTLRPGLARRRVVTIDNKTEPQLNIFRPCPNVVETHRTTAGFPEAREQQHLGFKISGHRLVGHAKAIPHRR
jgi:hypothetical protein